MDSQPLQNHEITSEESISFEDSEASPEECKSLLNNTTSKGSNEGEKLTFIELQIFKSEDREDSPANASCVTTLEKPESDVECRICRNKDDELLISPCKCSGSSKWIHESCLIQWFQISRTSRCELCSEKVIIKKYTKPISQWRRPKSILGPCNKVDLWYFFVTLFSFGTIIGFAIFQGCVGHGSDESPETLAVFVAIYILCGIMILVRIRYFYLWFTRKSTFWNSWKSLNQNWVIKSAARIDAVEEGAVI